MVSPAHPDNYPGSLSQIDEQRNVGGVVPLDTPTRLKLARDILEHTCRETGAGFVLVMFVPGTDLVMRSFRGLDTPQECVSASREVVNLLTNHAAQLAAKVQPKHNDA